MTPATTLQCFISEIPCLDDAADARLILADNASQRTDPGRSRPPGGRPVCAPAAGEFTHSFYIQEAVTGVHLRVGARRQRSRGHAGSNPHDRLRADHCNGATYRVSDQPGGLLRISDAWLDDIPGAVPGGVWHCMADRRADCAMA